MGRAGVTLFDIEKAALQLQGQGKNPTVDNIRELLGTGSKSTIAQHLRTWKAKQMDGQHQLPQELSALVAGLWERLNFQAEERIIAAEQACSAQIEELNQSLVSVHQAHSQLQAHAHQVEENLIAVTAEKTSCINQWQEEQQAHSKLIERHEITGQQLEEAKQENKRLHQLATNMQTNLEHYQQSIQQLRSEQTLAMEKQQIFFQQQVAELQQKLTSLQALHQDLEQQAMQKQVLLEQVQTSLQSLQQENAVLNELQQTTTQELSIYKERANQYESRIQQQEQQLQDTKLQLSHSDKQAIILQEQVSHLQRRATQAEDKVEVLRNEKLFLAQEKAHLEGYCKQLEKTTN